MYESSNLSYNSIKYGPLVIGLLCTILVIRIYFDPAFEITVNGVKRNAILSDSIIPIIFGLLSIIYYFLVGQRIVRMRISNNEFEFQIKGEKRIKNWSEVESIKKYWFVAPPLYSVKFINEEKTFLFSTGTFFLIIPFYVFDLSAMGEFIQKRKMDIPLLKDLKK